MSYYVRELTVRKYRGKPPAPIRGPDDVVEIVGRQLRKEKREHFILLLLNARHEIQGREVVSIGSLNASIVHPREVFLPAVRASAASIILVHNHPSGDVNPTHMDIELTKQIMAAANTLGLYFEDHLIIGPPSHVFSMNEAGILVPSAELKAMIASLKHSPGLARQKVWAHRAKE